MKNIIGILMSVLLSLSPGGCGRRDLVPAKTYKIPSNDSEYVESIKTKALEYLNANYDDTFTFVKSDNPSWVAPYHTLTFSSEKYEGQKFDVDYGANVAFENSTEEEKKFEDDYFKLQLYSEAEPFFNNILSECGINGVLKPRFVHGSRPEWLPANATFEEYLNAGCVSIELRVYSQIAIPREQQLDLINRLAALKDEYQTSWRNEDDDVLFFIDFILSELDLDTLKKLNYDYWYYDRKDDRSITMKSYTLYCNLKIREEEEMDW